MNVTAEGVWSDTPKGAVNLDLTLREAFRVTPRTAGELDLDKLNKEVGRTYSAAFESYEDSVDRIENTTSPSIKRIGSWCSHPDERVVIKFLETTRFGTGNKEGQFAIEHSLKRALRTAEEQDELWNPLMEVLSKEGYWAAKVYWGTPKGLIKLQDYVAERIQPWLNRNMGSVSVSDVMERTNAPGLVALIAGAAPKLSGEEARRVLRVCPDAVSSIAERPTLTPEVSTIVYDTLVDQVKTSTAEAASEDPDAEKTDYKQRRGLKETLEKMLEKGIVLEERHLDALFETLETTDTKGKKWYDSPVYTAITLLEDYARISGDQEVAEKLIIAGGKLSESTSLRWLFGEASWRTNNLELTPRLGRTAVEHCSHLPVVIEAVAGVDELRKDPVVRDKLLDSKAVFVVKMLISDEVEEEFPKLFKVLVRKDPEAAAKHLVKMQGAARGKLRKKDLAPLLKSEDREVRIAAIQLMSELKETFQEKRKAGRGR